MSSKRDYERCIMEELEELDFGDLLPDLDDIVFMLGSRGAVGPVPRG
jgi:hypothetical protein